MTWPQVQGKTAAERDAASKARQQANRTPHVKLRIVPTVTRVTWWQCKPEEFYDRAHKRAEELNVVSSSYLSDLERVG